MDSNFVGLFEQRKQNRLALKCSRPADTDRQQFRSEQDFWTSSTLKESFSGWITVIDSDMSIIYVTENVSLYTGITQVKKKLD